MSDTPASPAASADELDARLRARYAERVDLATLRALAGQRLSSLFVGAASAAYLRSPLRIMIVGRETMGWGAGLDADLAHAGRCATIEDYLAHQMRHQQRKIGEIGARSKFFQFHREVARRLARQAGQPSGAAPLWANLFCFDAAGTRPDRGVHAARIVALSIALLRAQVDVLRPQLILFATGSSCDPCLRTHLCEPGSSRVHLPKRLWEFRVSATDDHGHVTAIPAYRTPHPRHAASAAIRTALIEQALAPAAG